MSDLKDFIPLQKLICRELEDQLKQCQDGELPVGGSPNNESQFPELRKSLVDAVNKRLTHDRHQMQNLERELTETRALLAEVRECVQKAKNDVEFVLKMIRGAAATLEKDCMEDSELPEEPEEPATAMPEQPKQRVLPEKCSVKRKMS